MTAVSTLVQPVTDRDVRMLTTLLASCDPCGSIAGGESAEAYAGAARDVLVILDAGADETAVMLSLPDADVEPAHRFAKVAVHWWNGRVRSLPTLS